MKPYHGKGYNSVAKDAFFNEIFYEWGIESVFMKIRKENIRSIKAAEKLPYVVKANETRKSMYKKINADRNIYDLYEISKDQYTLHLLRNCLLNTDSSHLLEA
ncbi:GNAT family N-acetyltransferase [Bacillus sp. ISL-46]|nr:GNAT family N-acetyltransferase [Bacillus sp. ISL-46]